MSSYIYIYIYNIYIYIYIYALASKVVSKILTPLIFRQLFFWRDFFVRFICQIWLVFIFYTGFYIISVFIYYIFYFWLPLRSFHYRKNRRKRGGVGTRTLLESATHIHTHTYIYIYIYIWRSPVRSSPKKFSKKKPWKYLYYERIKRRLRKNKRNCERLRKS